MEKIEKYVKEDNFVIKLQAYPTKEQMAMIDRILHGVRVAYNATAYEITRQNPMVVKAGKKEPDTLWPDFSSCMKKPWLDWLRKNYEQVGCVPATSLSSSAYGIFSVDMKKAWEGFHPDSKKQAVDRAGNPRFTMKGKPVMEKTKEPVKVPAARWKPDYYSARKPRTSFSVQTAASGFVFKEGRKPVWVSVTNVGKIKCRGWRGDVRFGDEGPERSFQEQFEGTKKAFHVTMSKDSCGDYWIVAGLQAAWVPDKTSEEKKPIGIDVGVKDVTITSDGAKYGNRKFKRSQKRHARRLNRKMSRRQGWANEEFRERRKADKELKPSKGYGKAAMKKSRLERKIARKRGDYNDNVSASIVSGASFIGIEDLNVKGMMSNRHLAYALSDAAMSDLLGKVRYKAARHGVQVVEIGRWEPSSQICHVCGYKNPKMKDLGIRTWTCPKCGTMLDRDVNAARNILKAAEARRMEETGSGRDAGREPRADAT